MIMTSVGSVVLLIFFLCVSVRMGFSSSSYFVVSYVYCNALVVVIMLNRITYRGKCGQSRFFCVVRLFSIRLIGCAI